MFDSCGEDIKNSGLGFTSDIFFFLKFVIVKRHASEFSEDQQFYKLCFKSLISDSSLLFRILKCEP